MIKVFIIDDHQLIIEGIHTLLESEKDIEWLGSAKTPDDLLLDLKTKKPDVLLMDINLPQKSGLELCREIKLKYPAMHIVGLSTYDQPSIIRKMIDNGASGYLLKDASKNEIIEALHTVVAGKAYMNFSVAQALKNNMPPEGLPMLTRREKEVLELISDGLTNQDIADKLFLDVTTINSHRKNMLTKYQVKNTAAVGKLAISNHLI